MQRERKPLVVAATSDLFIQSRISQLAASLGLEARFATSEKGLVELASSMPRLVILDLSSEDYDPISTVRALKASSPDLRILGFHPHVRKDLEARAKSAGVNFVTPNSSFLKMAKQVLKTDMG